MTEIYFAGRQVLDLVVFRAKNGKMQNGRFVRAVDVRVLHREGRGGVSLARTSGKEHLSMQFGRVGERSSSRAAVEAVHYIGSVAILFTYIERGESGDARVGGTGATRGKQSFHFTERGGP